MEDEDLPETAYPLSYVLLGKEQSKDKRILAEHKEAKCSYVIQPFSGGGKTRNSICYNNKIVVPKSLQACIVQWYHDYLGHPGINRNEETIAQKCNPTSLIL
jgi:hypothetical protein